MGFEAWPRFANRRAASARFFGCHAQQIKQALLNLERDDTPDEDEGL